MRVHLGSGESQEISQIARPVEAYFSRQTSLRTRNWLHWETSGKGLIVSASRDRADSRGIRFAESKYVRASQSRKPQTGRKFRASRNLEPACWGKSSQRRKRILNPRFHARRHVQRHSRLVPKIPKTSLAGERGEGGGRRGRRRTRRRDRKTKSLF